jgi:bifunctional pyridoxal-dependent enzyme with beta-cystathionase and maltose regulon repressor activities
MNEKKYNHNEIKHFERRLADYEEASDAEKAVSFGYFILHCEKRLDEIFNRVYEICHQDQGYGCWLVASALIVSAEDAKEAAIRLLELTAKVAYQTGKVFAQSMNIFSRLTLAQQDSLIQTVQSAHAKAMKDLAD